MSQLIAVNGIACIYQKQLRRALKHIGIAAAGRLNIIKGYPVVDGKFFDIRFIALASVTAYKGGKALNIVKHLIGLFSRILKVLKNTVGFGKKFYRLLPAESQELFHIIGQTDIKDGIIQICSMIVIIKNINGINFAYFIQNQLYKIRLFNKEAHFKVLIA